MHRIAPLFLLCLICSCSPEKKQEQLPKSLILNACLNDTFIPDGGSLGGLQTGGNSFKLNFSKPIDLDKGGAEKIFFSGGTPAVSAGENDKQLVVTLPDGMTPLKSYTFAISAGEVFGLNLIAGYKCSLATGPDPADKFPRISTEELLDKVQAQTFRYFWDYAHPVSGLSRERLGSGETVTTGGSGFGIMCIPAAIERGFISREAGAQRIRTIVEFLSGKADRFHGAFSHWLNGSTGKVIPFSSNDNGGDLVETAFLVQGLLTAAQYFDAPGEEDIRSGIDAIWRSVEWDWYTRGGDMLYWHWSPDKGWAMNMGIRGWNEGLIVYVLAASSPTHPVSPGTYHTGWAHDGGIRNGKKYYDITLPLGSAYGGPLFFTHYSFLGLDPRNLKDKYAAYWEQNTAHARINHAYCVANPGKHAGYGDQCWGLTASDIPGGYAASSPTNDKGVIAPTAALSSFPYTPEQSLKALEYFYYVLGDKLWGEYGFKDAFCMDKLWFASSYIAIDQGPVVVMIENYRSGLLWNLFMQNADVSAGLDKLGFTR
ncbi:MAG: beta-glucosidase [Bacteroidales bacterium]|nr:beta-glucosidase [Bacteroidales bacterium]